MILPKNILQALIVTDLDHMSEHLLGMPYDILKKLIYPHPKYNSFIIKKRNGNSRTIDEPQRKIKNLQEIILNYIYEKNTPIKPCVHGFTRKRSIKTNAMMHCSQKTKYLLNVDIANFFQSITFYRVRGLFMKGPFNFSYSNATVLAHICTYNGTLPQGAPTSPIIANLVARSLDKELISLARRNRATYSRYCDDITFSFSVSNQKYLPKNICSFESGVLHLGEEFTNIFTKNSFQLNPDKSRISSNHNRLEVTGVIINNFPNVKREFIDKIRGGLHAWEKHGYINASEKWETYPYLRQLRTRKKPKLERVIWGKLLYLRMIRGANDLIYTRLAEKYNELCNAESANNPSFSSPSLPVARIVQNENDVHHAVFVIEWIEEHEGRLPSSQGTAFAYKDIGLITCDHIFRSGDDDFSEIKEAKFKIINPFTKEDFFGKIIQRDADRDTAIIDFLDKKPKKLRYFTTPETVIDRKKIGFLIGFPNHSAGRIANIQQSTVISTYKKMGLAHIEIDQNIRSGNSGGPFVDEQYRLAGIAQQGSKQDSGTDQCLCFTELDKWIRTH